VQLLLGCFELTCRYAHGCTTECGDLYPFHGAWSLQVEQGCVHMISRYTTLVLQYLGHHTPPMVTGLLSCGRASAYRKVDSCILLMVHAYACCPVSGHVPGSVSCPSSLYSNGLAIVEHGCVRCTAGTFLYLHHCVTCPLRDDREIPLSKAESQCGQEPC
jgi:hypothetical protein